jgi:hypothetical protein
MSPYQVNFFFLCIIHKEGLCSSSGYINRLMMMNINLFLYKRIFKFQCRVERVIFIVDKHLFRFLNVKSVIHKPLLISTQLRSLIFPSFFQIFHSRPLMNFRREINETLKVKIVFGAKMKFRRCVLSLHKPKTRCHLSTTMRH